MAKYKSVPTAEEEALEPVHPEEYLPLFRGMRVAGNIIPKLKKQLTEFQASMRSGRAASAKKHHPLVQKALDEGRMLESEASFYNGYARTKGNPETGTGAYGSEGPSEKMGNYIRNVMSGKEPVPDGWVVPVRPKFTPLTGRSDYSREELRKMPLDGFKKGGLVSSASKRADGIAQRGKTRGRVV